MSLPKRLLLPLSVLSLVVWALSAMREDSTTYRATVEKWRQAYQEKLLADDGWLTISGLFWLHEGQNTFGGDPADDIVLPEGSAPAGAGYFDLRAGKITIHVNPGARITMGGKPVDTAELQPDSKNSRLAAGGVLMWIHASGPRFTVRLWDKNSAVRKSFSGLHWFPVDESYRVAARYTAYEVAKEIDIQNLAGDPLKAQVSGYVTFTLHGQDLRLDAQADEKRRLSFIFRDLTSGKETYGAGRELDTEPVAADGSVFLDFNEANNPPCAYNPYTTCPIPPPQNRLHVRVEAGEMNYRHDH